MRTQLHIVIALLGVAALSPAAPAFAESSPATPATERIAALVAQDGSDAELKRFYDARSDVPAWTDETQIGALKTALAGAEAQALPKLAWPTEADPAARDVALTRVALQYAGELAHGRADPGKIESDWAIPAPSFDAAGGLGTALHHDLAAWYASLPPQHDFYRRLVTALARYRAIAASGGWVQVPRGGDPLKLGMVSDRVRILRERLETEGDFAPVDSLPAAPQASAPQAVTPAPAATATPGPITRVAAVATPAAAAEVDEDDPALVADPNAHYDDAVEAAVKRFQRRHGIAVDGALGPRTVAALNVPVRARIAQIELNLERWRALPHDLGPSYMMVNVPAEQLTIYEDGLPIIAMKTVVGDTGHPTPVVRTTMTAVTFNPIWRIPASIVKNEVLPKMKKDKSYLEKNDIEFVEGAGWQQPAGPKNPLGRIKFESPNQFDVYLHDTPSKSSFDRYARAQSHGCVRLEAAPRVAGLVLRDLAWNDQMISAAVDAGTTRRVDLKHRWRVWILYTTAFVDDTGEVNFRDDLYGRDGRLSDAIAASAGTKL